jgi:NAD(P)-dependent dehydrogenase (short-subunit alcohol dehydrogenase family)
VTGAGRGIGLALVEKLASDPHNVVFAGLRDINLNADHTLARLVAKKADAVQLIEISSANKDNNAAGARLIKEKYGKIDVIIANAGRHPSFFIYFSLTNRIPFRSSTHPHSNRRSSSIRLHHQHCWAINPLPIFRFSLERFQDCKICRHLEHCWAD